MNGLKPEDHFGTLGDLIGGLEPGKPCPWCGCPLELAKTVQDGGGGPSSDDDSSWRDAELVCPECGCEVRRSGHRRGMKRGGPFSAAA